MNEVYFEHFNIGNYFKTVAIHGGTGTEVSVSGPKNTPQNRREDLALKKLIYVMNKNNS